jgi:hypothetical protein
VRLTSKEDRRTFETRNVIRFKDYQITARKLKILDDDEEVPEEKPKQ